MKNTFNIIFYIKKTKPNMEGECPVYARITINGTRCELATQRALPEDQWNTKGGKVDEEEKVVLFYISAIVQNDFNIMNAEDVKFKDGLSAFIRISKPLEWKSKTSKRFV